MSRTTLNLCESHATAKTPEIFAAPDAFDIANARLALQANRNRLNQRDDARELLQSFGLDKLEIEL